MGNALGNYVPPFFVFPGARMREEFMKGTTPGSKGTVSPSGWSNSETFKFFLQNHATKYAKCNEDEHMLWIYDGHSTHVNPSKIEWAQSNRIILFVLPAHHSHILQPLDVGCFGPLQRIYNVKAQKFLREHPGEIITRNEVGQLASSAYILALSATNLMSSFRKTGIYPFNPDAYDKNKTLPNSIFPEELPADVCERENLNDPDLPHEPQQPNDQPVLVNSRGELLNEDELNNNNHSTSETLNAVVDLGNAVDEVESQNCDQSIANFLQSKVVKLKPKPKKARKTVSKLVAGKAITEVEIFEKICQYKQDKMKIKKSHSNDRARDKSVNRGQKNKQVSVVIASDIGDSKKGKHSDKGKRANARIRTAKVSPVATTDSSTVAAIPGPSHVNVSSDESDEFNEQDVCCVCKMISPSGLREILYNRILFVKWAQCEKCGHWVHVKFCTKGVDVRRTSTYLCPCCTNELENLPHEQ